MFYSIHSRFAIITKTQRVKLSIFSHEADLVGVKTFNVSFAISSPGKLQQLSVWCMYITITQRNDMLIYYRLNDAKFTESKNMR